MPRFFEDRILRLLYRSVSPHTTVRKHISLPQHDVTPIYIQHGGGIEGVKASLSTPPLCSRCVRRITSVNDKAKYGCIEDNSAGIEMHKTEYWTCRWVLITNSDWPISIHTYGSWANRSAATLTVALVIQLDRRRRLLSAPAMRTTLSRQQWDAISAKTLPHPLCWREKNNYYSKGPISKFLQPWICELSVNICGFGAISVLFYRF